MSSTRGQRASSRTSPVLVVSQHIPSPPSFAVPLCAVGSSAMALSGSSHTERIPACFLLPSFAELGKFSSWAFALLPAWRTHKVLMEVEDGNVVFHAWSEQVPRLRDHHHLSGMNTCTGGSSECQGLFCPLCCVFIPAEVMRNGCHRGQQFCLSCAPAKE